ncbi:MAG: asparagine synthase (glutamine-hydrolyzing), partial [Salibacteraceae bacterium]
MCGIAGIIDFNFSSSKVDLESMGKSLEHRGPDSSGVFWVESSNFQLGLAHQRLSIIDVSKDGNQPMHLSSPDFSIVFNGEIYNYQEVRTKLIAKGVHFKTKSDTEVILCAWRQWGKECIKEFNGMFAFAIYDKAKQVITLVRDRVGVKPLYIYKKDGLILFGSELKGLVAHPKFEKEIDLNGTALYMQYGYYPEPYTVFKNCIKLKAGFLCEVSLKNREINHEEYWSLKPSFYSKTNISKPEKELIEELDLKLKDSFKYRMVSDVPVGVFLSGGYDSTAVTAMLQSATNNTLNTFTIGFEEEKYNEADHAKKVSNYLGTNHEEKYCSFKDAMSIIPRLSTIYDEPFADSSAIPTTLLSEMAVKKVKVALSADGGDELFSGYGKYQTTQRYVNELTRFSGSNTAKLGMNLLEPILPLNLVGFNFKRRYSRVKELISSGVIPVRAMQFSSQNLMRAEIESLFKNKVKLPTINFESATHDFENGDDYNAMLICDYKTYLVDDILAKVDRATMSVSLESREPLLDYR